jgi:hypothetical protein
MLCHQPDLSGQNHLQKGHKPRKRHEFAAKPAGDRYFLIIDNSSHRKCINRYQKNAIENMPR